MRKLSLAALVTAMLGVALLVPGMILAGGPTIPSDPPMPPIHRHYLVKPDKSTQPVGPNWCANQDNLAIQLAFYNFHYNVHFGASPGADGLDIRSQGGCVVPIPPTVP